MVESAVGGSEKGQSKETRMRVEKYKKRAIGWKLCMGSIAESITEFHRMFFIFI